MRAWLRAAIVYAVAAVIFTWPLALHPFAVLGSTQGPGDPYLNLWILGWDLRAILHHPSSLLSGRVFDSNIFYPATGTLAYSDHLLLQAAALAPVYWLTGQLTFCYNLLLFASLVGCALAMHAYIRELAGESPAAWIGGLVWGFAPYHFAHLIHLQLQALYFLPLTFLFLHRLVARGRTRDALWLGVMLAAQALSSVYYGVIGGLAITVAAAVSLLDADRARFKAIAGRLIVAALVGALLVGPVALKYWWVQQREGFGRSLREASQGLAAARAYVEVPPVNLLYARSGLLRSHDGTDPIHKASEQNLFPGFVLAGLALVGVSAVRRRAMRGTVSALIAVTTAGFVLSLGPDGVRPLYGVLYQWIFGFQAIRAPARFAVLTLFGLAALAALGTDTLLRKRGRVPFSLPSLAKKAPDPFFAILVSLIALEYLNAPIAYVPAPQLDTAPGRWLHDAPEPGAVVYLPLDLDAGRNTTFMVQSLAHARPIVNGYSGERPAFFAALADATARFPSPEALKTLLDLHVTFVVAPAPVDARALPPSALVERARLSDGVIYEIRESPELDTMLTLPETAPLPEITSIPFAVGEKAVYSVVWSSGSLSVPAGHITLEVRPGTNGARYELAASAVTAAWVSNFFQADDRFASAVDDRLRSLSFEQHLKEGRRQVDRRAVFDRQGRVVRVQQGSGPEVSLPIPPDTRDPLALLYYARTLPLTPGSGVLMPLNDSNRNLVVDFRVGDAETIAYNGVPIDTVRTTVQIRRVQGPIPAQLTIWLARDATKLPIKAEISGIAGVGAARLELESGR